MAPQEATRDGGEEISTSRQQAPQTREFLALVWSSGVVRLLFIVFMYIAGACIVATCSLCRFAAALWLSLTPRCNARARVWLNYARGIAIISWLTCCSFGSGSFLMDFRDSSHCGHAFVPTWELICTLCAFGPGRRH
jgi:hypothetical protein